MPGPVSNTSTSTSLPEEHIRALIPAAPPAEVNLRALERRFSTTWWMRQTSTLREGRSLSTWEVRWMPLRAASCSNSITTEETISSTGASQRSPTSLPSSRRVMSSRSLMMRVIWSARALTMPSFFTCSSLRSPSSPKRNASA